MPTIREWVTGARGRATRKRRHANAERREQRDQHWSHQNTGFVRENFRHSGNV